MARLLRIEYEGAFYHVTSRGNHQNNIFDDDEDRECFLKIFTDVVSRQGWVCHGYCLMSNHYHLIIETPHANLSKGMRQLNGVYTQSYNRRHSKVGHLFQGRYKSIIVDAQAYLLELSRYVVLNPVRAGMVKDASEWPWSSYRAMIGDAIRPDLLRVDMILNQFSEQKDKAECLYAGFVAEGVGKESIWSNLRQQVFLGHDDFISTAQAKAKGSFDNNVPKVQQLAPAKPLHEIANAHKSRNAAIVAAYQSGAYSYSQIAGYFNVHFTTVGRIVRGNKRVV
ncbi:MAG: transposase [Mariprofundaceae bacterium]|nr:transposase [Mariprofundaceae bacterium]